MDRLPLVLALILAGNPSPSAADEAKFYGNWLVGESDGEKFKGWCHAFMQFKNDHSLMVQHDAKSDRTVVAIANPDATSLQDGQEIFMDIGLLNSKGGIQWEYSGIKFFVIKTESGSIALASGALSGFISQFSKAVSIAFAYNERNVGRYDLSGSATAMSEVRKCSIRLNGLNPNDPFLPQ